MGTRVRRKQAGKKKGSSYQRNKKAPTLYSAEYYAWVKAVKENRDPTFAAANHDKVLERSRRLSPAVILTAAKEKHEFKVFGSVWGDYQSEAA